MEENLQNLPESAEVVDIQFRPGQKIYFFDPDGVRYEVGDHVIMDTARGDEFGIVTRGNHQIPMKEVVAPLRKVLRLANAQDEKTIAENRAREKRAFEACLQKIGEHGLDMQLVSAECAFDGSKILFYFTADERVDFRELVKNLASIFHTRIELRQIGVRDKAKMVGGLGICGRPFCCASFLDDFQPVSIKMAKTQHLSLNPTKISGTCGRLMCCLKYEQDTYEALIRRSPKEDSFVDTPEGRGTVVEVDLLRSRVKVRMEEDANTISVFSNDEIAVLRSGKAKKNDPPIPADLAPISGSGKRSPREKEVEKLTLEPIRFRYSEEKVVEEPEEVPAVPEQQPEEAPAPARPSRRRRRGSDKAKAEAPAPKAGEKPKKEQPKKEQPKAEGKKAGESPDAPKAEKSRRHRQKAPAAPKEPQEPKQATPAPAEGEQSSGKPRRPNHRRRKPNKPQDAK